jgi:hypothetical protein
MHELGGAIKIMRDRRTSTSKIETVRQMMAELRSRLEAHNKLAENLVYRLAAKLLESEEQTALELQNRRRAEEFATAIPSRGAISLAPCL